MYLPTDVSVVVADRLPRGEPGLDTLTAIQFIKKKKKKKKKKKNN
jgi:hypothetical protein